MKTTASNTRPVPAERLQVANLRAVRDAGVDHIDEALTLVYQARGLIAGASLLAAAARFTSAGDRALQRDHKRVAARARAAWERCSLSLADFTQGFTAEQITNVVSELDTAHGLLKVLGALLDSTDGRDELDECLQALDLYALALEHVEPIQLELYAAIKVAREAA